MIQLEFCAQHNHRANVVEAAICGLNGYLRDSSLATTDYILLRATSRMSLVSTEFIACIQKDCLCLASTGFNASTVKHQTKLKAKAEITWGILGAK